MSLQGVGNILSCVIILVCLAAGASYDFTWRFGLAFGALPTVIAFYFRWNMAETALVAVSSAARPSLKEHTLQSGRIIWVRLLQLWVKKGTPPTA